MQGVLSAGGERVFREGACDQDLAKLVNQSQQLRARDVLHQHYPFQVVVTMEIPGQPNNEEQSIVSALNLLTSYLANSSKSSSSKAAVVFRTLSLSSGLRCARISSFFDLLMYSS